MIEKIRAYLSLTFTLIGLVLLIAVAKELMSHGPALGITGGTVATYATAPARCTQISADCGDVTPWQRWPDADPGAGWEVLHCGRVRRRYNGAPAYEMDGPHGLASHNEIAAWFRLGRDGQRAFMAECNR